MTLVFGGWSVSPKVSVFLIALVLSAVPVEETVRARSMQLAVARDGQRQPTSWRSGSPVLCRVALIVLAVVPQVVRLSAR